MKMRDTDYAPEEGLRLSETVPGKLNNVIAPSGAGCTPTVLAGNSV